MRPNRKPLLTQFKDPEMCQLVAQINRVLLVALTHLWAFVAGIMICAYFGGILSWQ